MYNVQAILLFEIWINVGLGITFAHSRLVLLWGFNSKFFIRVGGIGIGHFCKASIPIPERH